MLLQPILPGEHQSVDCVGKRWQKNLTSLSNWWAIQHLTLLSKKTTKGPRHFFDASRDPRLPETNLARAPVPAPRFKLYCRWIPLIKTKNSMTMC